MSPSLYLLYFSSITGLGNTYKCQKMKFGQRVLKVYRQTKLPYDFYGIENLLVICIQFVGKCMLFTWDRYSFSNFQY